MNEAWNLIDNPIFAPQLAGFLERLKQKNCVVIFVSSDVEAVNDSDIIFEIKRAISGEIYTANREPDQFYRTVLELSDDEINIVRMLEDDERHFIFKHRGDVVIASLNLRNCPEILKILAADELTLTAAEEIMAVNKDETGKLVVPKEWVPQLFEILQEIQKDKEEARRQALIDAAQEERKRKEALELGI